MYCLRTSSPLVCSSIVAARLAPGRARRVYDETTSLGSRCRKVIQIGQNGYYKVMQRYGVERPPPPISWNERRWLAEQERATQPDAEQGALFTLHDTRKAA